jgi:hypothetical protein
MSRYVVALPGVLAFRWACDPGFSDEAVEKAGAMRQIDPLPGDLFAAFAAAVA